MSLPVLQALFMQPCNHRLKRWVTFCLLPRQVHLLMVVAYRGITLVIIFFHSDGVERQLFAESIRWQDVTWLTWLSHKASFLVLAAPLLSTEVAEVLPQAFDV